MEISCRLSHDHPSRLHPDKKLTIPSQPCRSSDDETESEDDDDDDDDDGNTPSKSMHNPVTTTTNKTNHTHNNPRGDVKFPIRLHEMLQAVHRDGVLTDVVSWNPDGNGFRVHKKPLFTETLMPRYFSPSKYRSFQRQLNHYGFERIPQGPFEGGYKHPNFVKDQPQKCHLIKRLKRESRVPTKPTNSAQQLHRRRTSSIEEDRKLVATVSPEVTRRPYVTFHSGGSCSPDRIQSVPAPCSGTIPYSPPAPLLFRYPPPPPPPPSHHSPGPNYTVSHPRLARAYVPHPPMYPPPGMMMVLPNPSTGMGPTTTTTTTTQLVASPALRPRLSSEGRQYPPSPQPPPPLRQGAYVYVTPWTYRPLPSPPGVLLSAGSAIGSLAQSTRPPHVPPTTTTNTSTGRHDSEPYSYGSYYQHQQHQQHPPTHPVPQWTVPAVREPTPAGTSFPPRGMVPCDEEDDDRPTTSIATAATTTSQGRTAMVDRETTYDGLSTDDTRTTAKMNAMTSHATHGLMAAADGDDDVFRKEPPPLRRSSSTSPLLRPMCISRRDRSISSCGTNGEFSFSDFLDEPAGETPLLLGGSTTAETSDVITSPTAGVARARTTTQQPENGALHDAHSLLYVTWMLSNNNNNNNNNNNSSTTSGTTASITSGGTKGPLTLRAVSRDDSGDDDEQGMEQPRGCAHQPTLTLSPRWMHETLPPPPQQQEEEEEGKSLGREASRRTINKCTISRKGD
jgi:HSF-type DNA-binding